MVRDFIPSGDAELLAWVNNFANVVAASTAANFGLTDLQMTAFEQKQSAYATAYQTAFEPTTRTRPAIEARNLAKKNLVAYARKLVKLVQAAPVVNDEKRLALKITVAKPKRPIPQPTQRPTLKVDSVVGRTVFVNVYDGDSATKRGKPAGAIAAKLYVFSGATYPADPTLWNYVGDYSRTKCDVVFPDTAPSGQQVWITAAWATRKGLVGPPAVAITINLQGGGAQPTAGMKIAA